MKQKLFLLIVCCFLLKTFLIAQQNRFLYIQTEDKQPFYVNLNNVIFSSSASGYLIIPKLQEGNYQLNIGFPKNEWPRQVISYTIGKKDQGVVLKKFGEEGWGFHNLQSNERTLAASNRSLVATSAVEDDDSFTRVLAEVVNTPDLGRKETPDPAPVPVSEVKQSEPILATVSSVSRISENVNDQGREMAYVADGDTVTIFIPANIPSLVKTDINTESATPRQQVDAEKPVAETPKVKEDAETIIGSKTETDIKPVADIVKEKAEQKPAALKMVNSDCKAEASDEDFMKLRKKMASEEAEVKMVVVAKKAFRSKCYTAEQIKNLSVLFLNDSGRFQFFESAYPFVLDSNNFVGLQSQLTDPYYITRFEALTRR